MSTSPTVAVIGAGASGTLTTAHLARAAFGAGRSLDILLIDPDPVGTGLAYSTADPRHRLNVPAKGMSAWPEDPEHFLRWVRRHVSCDFPATGFAPRLHYAQYLATVLDEAEAHPGVHIEHVRARATGVAQIGRRLRLTLGDGTSRPADAVVLATGHGHPSSEWAPASLRRAPQFVADPWADGATPTTRRGDDVLLVGAGLTAADMAMRWGREGVRVHVASRHGMLPLPHTTVPQPPLPAPPVPAPASLAELRRAVFAAIRAADGDWRRVVDGLRPVTTPWWCQLDADNRRAFLTAVARRWDRVRHRVDPTVHTWLEQRRTEGSLVVHAARVTDARVDGDIVEVTLSDGSAVRASAVLNCTGTTTPITTSDDPLLMNLLDRRLAEPGPLDLGLATDADGRLLVDGERITSMWAVGPLRRGQLWESTAVPEIRAQASSVADDVVAALPVPHARRRPRDPYGLPLSAEPAAGAMYVRALNRILRVQSGADALVAGAVRADPRFALGHATLAVLGAEWGADVDVEASLHAAEAQSVRADERERRFVEVATARVRRPGAESAAALLSYIQTYPEDALAVSIAVPTIAFGGATEIPAEAWALVDGLAPAYGDNWWYQGLLAFTRQDQGRYDEAAELAARALLTEPAAGHAVHAKAHVHYETGDHRAGLAWLDGWIATCGAHASHRAHFSWHAGLHELALDDRPAVAARYAAQLRPPAVSGVRALVDSASLLWRARLAGVPSVGEIADVVAAVPPALLTRPPTPFVALHAAVTLAAAGDCRGLTDLRRYAAAQDAPQFAETIAPLTDCLLDLIHGDADRAATGFLALRGVEGLGGSAAQREVVEDTLIHCAAAAGRVELATMLLTDRLHRRAAPRELRQRTELIQGAVPARLEQ